MNGPPTPPATRRAHRRFLLALGASIAAHALALVAMVTLLGPGLDTAAPAVDRARYVAEHPWAWRLGWLPWQLTALSDVLVSLALLDLCLRLRRGTLAAALALAATVLAVVPDQWGEILFDTTHVAAAREVVAGGGDLEAWVRGEARGLLFTGTCGGSGYALMLLFWIAAAARLGGPGHRAFVALGLFDFALFAVAAWVNGVATTGATAADGYPWFPAVYWLNAIAFPVLLVWMTWMAAPVGEPFRSDGELHRLVPPDGSPLRDAALRAAAHPGLRDLARACLPPMPALRSDVEDVVYLNWRVPAERVRGLLPPPLALHEIDGHTFLSILTYRHGAFGPRLAGAARRLFPSPVQSNWRLYVEPERDGAKRDAIWFFKTTLAHDGMAMGARLLSDGLPAQVPRGAAHARRDGRIATVLDPGGGSAPDLLAIVRELDAPPEVEAARDFGGWRGLVEYLVHQNRGLSVVHGEVIESRIRIPIDPDGVVPAAVEQVESRFLAPLVEGCEPFAFVVPRVIFEALGERATAKAP